MSHRTFVNRLDVDLEGCRVLIDGVELPFWLREVPSVEAATQDYPFNVVTLELLAENVHLITNKGVRFFDQHGDRSEWAKVAVNQIVEERLGDTLAWLRGAGVDV